MCAKRQPQLEPVGGVGRVRPVSSRPCASGSAACAGAPPGGRRLGPAAVRLDIGAQRLGEGRPGASVMGEQGGPGRRRSRAQPPPRRGVRAAAGSTPGRDRSRRPGRRSRTRFQRIHRLLKRPRQLAGVAANAAHAGAGRTRRGQQVGRPLLRRPVVGSFHEHRHGAVADAAGPCPPAASRRWVRAADPALSGRRTTNVSPPPVSPNARPRRRSSRPASSPDSADPPDRPPAAARPRRPVRLRAGVNTASVIAMNGTW